MSLLREPTIEDLLEFCQQTHGNGITTMEKLPLFAERLQSIHEADDASKGQVVMLAAKKYGATAAGCIAAIIMDVDAAFGDSDGDHFYMADMPKEVVEACHQNLRH